MARPNELREMGRLNAGLVKGVTAPVARGRLSFVPGASPSAAEAGRAPTVPLLAAGAALWFLVSTAVELYDSGDPTLEGQLFLGTIVVTCLLAGRFGRSSRDDLATAIGSGLGLLVSSVLVAVEPAGHPLGDILGVALMIIVPVVLLSPVVRLVLRPRRRR
ncbi:MAG TPA: hypothetical protein VEY67_03550 [Candidatus Dormibacteraeota bacterium]|nr:hypothetical protein [Candidatus Dormibacteraeota bacterium]